MVNYSCSFKMRKAVEGRLLASPSAMRSNDSNKDWWWYDDESPYSPVISGGLVATTRSWWQESGGFDPGMHGWGPLAICLLHLIAVCSFLLNRETLQFKFLANSTDASVVQSISPCHVLMLKANPEIHPS